MYTKEQRNKMLELLEESSAEVEKVIKSHGAKFKRCCCPEQVASVRHQMIREARMM